MNIWKTVLSIIFVLVCITLSVMVLLQEGKSTGSGALTGKTDSYWNKNKGRSADGALKRGTSFLLAVFLIMAFILNLNL